jgi:hypothetical protein
MSSPTKKSIVDLYGNKCFYCDIELNERIFTKDHVIPKSKGGKDTLANLVPCCVSCNLKKADMILTREEVRALKGRYGEVRRPTRPDVGQLKWQVDLQLGKQKKKKDEERIYQLVLSITKA